MNTISQLDQLIDINGWLGIGSPLAGQMFFRATSFATFYSSLTAIVGENQSASPSQYILAGGLTGFCISFIEVIASLT